MNLGDMYGVVLTFVLVGLILGIGLLVLQNFQSASGVVGTSAATSINETQTAIGTISSTWLPVIVVIVAAAIILGLVMRSFAGKQ